MHIWSKASLGIVHDDVEARQLPASDGSYTFKYTGLRLLIRSDEKLFVIPWNWSYANPRTFVIADDDSIRVDVAPSAEITGPQWQIDNCRPPKTGLLPGQMVSQ